MIKDFRGKYLVFDDGTIFRVTKNGLKLNKQHRNKSGYLMTNIHKKPMFIHRIVMEAFNGYSELTVDHIDGNKENNDLNNLEYVTVQENVRRSWDSGKRNHLRVYKIAYLCEGVLYDSKEDAPHKKEYIKIKYKEI